MIKARKNKLFENLFSVYNTRILKKNFFRLLITGEEQLTLWNKVFPALIYANHSNWWDGLVAFYLSKVLWNIDAYVIMDIEQMNRYRFFKWIGAFSVNRNSPKEAAESVNYSIELLKNSNRVLWIFPQGLMQPNDYRPIKFYNGISKIAQSIGELNLIPVVFRYEFINEQHPEIFISVGEIKHLTKVDDVKSLTEKLNTGLVAQLDSLKDKISKSETGEFRIILHGKKSRNKTIDKLYGGQ
jgi:chlorobactene lauroyltransferase